MITVGRDDVVIGAEQRERAGAHRLLADVQVAEATDLSERVRLGGTLLEAALQEHRPEHPEIEIAVGG